MNTNNNKIPLQTTKGLFTKYDGITSRINTLFSYHYDQIQREIEHEIRNLSKEEQYLIMDHLVEYMEEVMNWPSNGTNEEFINSIFS